MVLIATKSAVPSLIYATDEEEMSAKAASFLALMLAYHWPEVYQCILCYPTDFLVAQLVNNPPAIQETPVQFLGQENPLEKGMATQCSILRLPLWLSW